jgi:hypothetical protein
MKDKAEDKSLEIRKGQRSRKKNAISAELEIRKIDFFLLF